MKKYIWIGVALALAFGLSLILSNRGSELSVENSSGRVQVVTSIPLLKYLTETIGGDEVVVKSIITGASCSHEYEPSTGDMKTIAHAHLAIKAGMAFDSWFDRLVASSMKGLTVVDASYGVTVMHDGEGHHHELVSTGSNHTHKHSDQHGHNHGDKEVHQHQEEHEEVHSHSHELGNPHYWGNPENVRIMAKNIMESLGRIRPEKESLFKANYQVFDEQLMHRAAELKQKVDELPGKKIVSYSAAFPYFFTYFGFENLETVETTCEQEVSPRRIVEVAGLMGKRKITIIVGEKIYPNLPDGLARETGARVVLLWPSTIDSGDYIKTMEENVESMVLALQ